MARINLDDKEQIAQLAQAKPEERLDAINEMRPLVAQRIRDQLGYALDVAPTFHFLPFQPRKGYAKQVERALQQAIKELKTHDDVYEATVYRLVQTKSGPGAAPAYMVMLACANAQVMERLLQNENLKQLAENLQSMSSGQSGTEAGEHGLNSLLLGLV